MLNQLVSYKIFYLFINDLPNMKNRVIRTLKNHIREVFVFVIAHQIFVSDLINLRLIWLICLHEQSYYAI